MEYGAVGERGEMRKISIARRRLEISGCAGVTEAERRAHRRDRLSLVGGTSLAKSKCQNEESLSDRSRNLVFPMTEQQLSSLDALMKQKNHQPLSGSLSKRAEGVFILQLGTPPGQKRYLSSKEVADLLGVSRVSIYRLSRRGRLHAYRIGRLLRFDFENVLDFLSSCLEN